MTPVLNIFRLFQSKPMKKSLLVFLLLMVTLSWSPAQQVDPAYYQAIKWRLIGPHRGGRTVGAVGVPSQPNVFYIGVNNGGVWKTNDFGLTWKPIFDDQPTGSVGDVVVAPSNPNIIYVASGEGIQRPDLSIGNGIYKSTDGGRSWTNTGIRDGQQIGGLAIDPQNENRVFAAVLGHPYGPNTERGVFRTIDGGKNWERVFYIDENSGAAQVTLDPKNSNIVYADIWAARQGPWENGAWQGKASGLYKSTDGGNTWSKLTKGLPTYEQGLGRIGFCIAPSDPNRLYATVDSPQAGGIYRSDDAGASWYRTTADARIWSRGSDFAEVKVHPQNPDVVFSANVVTWKSTDGGKNWTGIKGAPGGDDYHRIWINPNNPDIMLLGLDQGATITVNGGQTWSSWYNQPTAQFYHVSTDNEFPYNVYGGQQESGSVGIVSRSNDGQITFRDWHPVGVEEYGYVAVDPLNPNMIYGGKITRYDKRTGQIQNIAPEAVRSGKYRFIRTAPVLFSPTDPKTLYFAGNVVFKTQTGGESWEVISPDLTREAWDIPKSVGVYTSEEMKKMPRRGVVYTLAPSYVDGNTIWAGTDDGLIQVTRDGGKTWKNVTPPAISSWMKVSVMDASHFDANTAYAAVNAIRLDDMKAHIFRTQDGGATWQEITKGLPDSPINAVKEDPIRKGLLYCGSETGVSVSFDNGDSWQSLRLNMPATSVRDLVIKDDDLVIGTHGRSFWILDNVTPLRQLSGTTGTQLFKPAAPYRVRWSMYPDTPLPPEEPAGQNPPDGAMIDYYLEDNASTAVTLEILDANNNLVRKYSSEDKPYAVGDVNIPLYWIRPQEILSAAKGPHRFLWDLRYAPLDVPPSYPISAIYQQTAPEPTSPFVMPGNYIVKLTVGGKSFTQPLTVKMDPRVKLTTSELQTQFDLSLSTYSNRKTCLTTAAQVHSYREQIKSLKAQARGTIPAVLAKADDQLAQFESNQRIDNAPGFARLADTFGGLFSIVQEADMPVTSQAKAGIKQATDQLSSIQVLWNNWMTAELPRLNTQLRKSGLSPLR